MLEYDDEMFTLTLLQPAELGIAAIVQCERSFLPPSTIIRGPGKSRANIQFTFTFQVKFSKCR